MQAKPLSPSNTSSIPASFKTHAVLMFFRAIILFSAILMISCKKESSPDTPRILSSKVKSELNAMADRVFLETATPGLIALISVDGEKDLLIKRGTANLTTNAPIHEDNAFRLASVTKTFTGTAVLLLADEGLISPDSAISGYLPEYNIPSGDKVTVRMLGNMTSGLFNYSDDPGMWELFTASGYTMVFPPDSLLAIAFRHPMSFPPGSSYEYCNTNTVLLGLLLEKVTGKPAYQVIKERVIEPLKLTGTYFGGPFFMTGPYTHGYTIQDQGLLDATNWNPSWGYTAGAIISNLADMKKWASYLAGGALLSEKTKAERFNFGKEGYGFCVESIHYKSDLWIGHPGSIPGYNTQVWRNPAKKITLCIYSNTEDEWPAQTLLTDIIIYLGNL